MFKYSVALIAILFFMGGCALSSKSFRPDTVSLYGGAGKTDYTERGPGTTVTSTNGHGHGKKTTTTVNSKRLNGKANSWNLGAGITWKLIYKDEEKSDD